MKKTLVPLVLIIVFCVHVQANMIINGDFENNSATGTDFNLNNSAFNSKMHNATAFGTSEEIDLVTGTDYGIIPRSGKWKLGLHQRTIDPTRVDAFSLELSSQVLNGSNYVLQFYAAGFSSAPIGPVEIGLSDNPSDFGVLIYTGLPTSDSAWTQFNHAFNAPVDAAYLTVRNAAETDMYVFVDNFSLVPEPATLCLLALGTILAVRKR